MSVTMDWLTPVLSCKLQYLQPYSSKLRCKKVEHTCDFKNEGRKISKAIFKLQIKAAKSSGISKTEQPENYVDNDTWQDDAA